MSKAAMNLQDSFLNQVRRENTEVKVLLVNGTGLRGIVKGFDNFTVILQSRNGQHLIYKHAIAQLMHQKHGGPRREGDETGAGMGDIVGAEGESTPSAGSSAPAAPPANAGGQGQRSDQQGQNRPRREGFNRLDLSSVRLSSDTEEKVETK